MDVDELVERLRSEKGTVRVEIMPDDLFDRVVEEESGVSGAMGNMPIINSGLKDCIERRTRVCVFEDLGFWHPDVRSMRMLDSNGNMIGHDLTDAEIPEFMGRDDVVFISDDFVMYPYLPMEGTTTMELLSIPYRGRGDWIPEEASAVLWYPCSTSSDMIHEYYHQPNDKTASGILALNL